MRYKPYGRTGKQVSAVGFGGMRFDMAQPREANADLVQYAYEQGITYFDTAPGYCGGESEAIFGAAFREMRGEYYVSTKAMPVHFDTAAKAREAVEKSLEQLGVAKIDFYHIWCIRKMEHWELAMRPGGQYEGLLECQQEGLIDHIVFSSHQPGHEIRQILQQRKVEGVLLGLNILNFPYRWDGVQAAHDLGCGVVAMNPLVGGMIPQHEDRFAFLAGPGETPTEAALRFLIACPQVSVALNGFVTRAHIDTACRVADTAEPFTDADLARVRQHLSANMNQACTGCGYCLEDCPAHIPVAGYMQYYNDKTIFGADDAKMREALRFQHDWGLLVGRQAEAGDCLQCGNCDEACTQHLPIMDRLREIAAWEADLREPESAAE